MTTIPGATEPQYLDKYLRDVYARLSPSPITDHDPEEEEALYMQGPSLVNYLARHPECDAWITLVVKGLRHRYHADRLDLPEEEIAPLTTAFKTSPPSFTRSLKQEYFDDETNLAEYELSGIVTPYDVVHTTVPYFLTHINNWEYLEFALLPTNTRLRLTYEDFDFWDPQSQQVIKDLSFHPCL